MLQLPLWNEACMAMFAEAVVFKVNLPYSEYWLPLLVGMAVGLCAVTVSRLVFGRKKESVAPPEPRQRVEFDPFTQGSPTEQRKSFRRQGNPIEVYVAVQGDKERPLRGWVLDRSMGGVCLQIAAELDPGAQLAVLPVNAPNTTPWVDIEVRSCRAVQEHFELGCRFAKTPAWSILLLFG
jgi:hypothetical protein